MDQKISYSNKYKNNKISTYNNLILFLKIFRIIQGSKKMSRKILKNPEKEAEKKLNKR